MLTLESSLLTVLSQCFIPFAVLLMSLHASDPPGRTADQLHRGKLPLKVRICGRKEGGDGPEESSEVAAGAF